jgi:uncharacterized membrane protein
MNPPNPAPALADNHTRSIVKAISWRATGTVDTIIVSFLVTGRIKMAVSIGGIELFTKVCLYYFHERLWNRVRFGRVPARQDYEI